MKKVFDLKDGSVLKIDYNSERTTMGLWDISVGIPTKPTIEQWRDYLAIQKSGVTNMFNTNAIYCCSKHDLNRGVCYYIMHHYEELEKEFGFTIDSITDADMDDLLIGSYMD